MPKFQHYCKNCRYLGTLFDKVDFYCCQIHPAHTSYIIKTGNNESDFYCCQISKSDLKETQIKLNNLTTDEIIVLTMLKHCPALILNELKKV